MSVSPINSKSKCKCVVLFSLKKKKKKEEALYVILVFYNVLDILEPEKYPINKDIIIKKTTHTLVS